MFRIDLLVPFAEKDDAKKLGAKWDPEHKVWYIPEGLDVRPFQKWMRWEKPRRKRVQRNPPPFILFKPNAEGFLAARIDDLEVGFDVEDGGYIVIWGTESGLICDYTDSTCPDDKDRHWKNCPLADNCPYEFTNIIPESSTGMSGEGTRTELEVKIRDMFKNMHDGIAHRQRWPEPAASEFASVPWRFEETKPATRR